jgi:hypothetical protein
MYDAERERMREREQEGAGGKNKHGRQAHKAVRGGKIN